MAINITKEDKESIERWLRKKYKGKWVLYVRCPYCLNRQVISSVTYTCAYCNTKIDLRSLKYNLTTIIITVSGPTGKESEIEKIQFVRRLLYGNAKPLPWL